MMTVAPMIFCPCKMICLGLNSSKYFSICSMRISLSDNMMKSMHANYTLG